VTKATHRSLYPLHPYID